MTHKVAGAEVIPYSSIVGGGVLLTDAGGKVVGQVCLIGLHRDLRTKDAQQDIMDTIAAAINAKAAGNEKR